MRRFLSTLALLLATLTLFVTCTAEEPPPRADHQLHGAEWNRDHALPAPLTPDLPQFARVAEAPQPSSKGETPPHTELAIEALAPAANFALLLFEPAGPYADRRVELWADPSTADLPACAEKVAVDTTDPRGWVSWENLPYGRYLVCAPFSPGHRGYRGPGTHGPVLMEFEHRVDWVAERMVELSP